MRSLSDNELLILARSQPRAFEEFYMRHERAVLAYFRRRVASAELAADLAAETFAAALGSVARFRPRKEPALAWLFAIARHKLLKSLERGRIEDRARRRVGMPRLEFDDAQLARIDRLGAGTADEWLARLPADQAAAVRARVIDEQPYRSIAKQLRCSELVAHKRVSRGLASLRDVVEQQS